MKVLNMQQARKQKGFTLIEIAIVLVIIGLLLGGVLQGQQLIENSRVKSAVNDFNGIAAGAFSYQDRYGRLPGDDPGATTARGTSWKNASAAMTAGNGVLDDAMSVFAPAAGEETVIFFQDLRSAGFISGDPSLSDKTALPANPFGGLITVAAGTMILSDGTNDLNGTKVCMGNVSGTAAIALDTQLDDGKSQTGRFRAAADLGVPNAAPNTTADTSTATTSGYNEDKTYTVCYRI